MKTQRPLTGFSSRLPTATMNGYRPRGAHEKLPVAWKIAAIQLQTKAEKLEETLRKVKWN